MPGSRGSARRWSPSARGSSLLRRATGCAASTAGTVEGVIAAARRALAPERAGRVGVAPVALLRARGRGPARGRARGAAGRRLVRRRGAARAYLAPLPVALLRARARTAELPEALERLGVARSASSRELPAAKVADRFGAPACWRASSPAGATTPLRPRGPASGWRSSLELPEAASGPQLERALELLIDRLLARRERRGRTLRAVVLGAALVEGGTWRERVAFREALADPVRMRLALAPRLALLPAPAESLRLAVERFGPPPADQRAPAARTRRRPRRAPARGRAPGARGGGA